MGTVETSRVEEKSRRWFLKVVGGSVTATVLAVAEKQWGVLSVSAKVATNLLENLLKNQTENASRLLESRYFLPTPSEAEVRKLSFIPKGELLGDEYLSTVSPKLQERARKAGYRLVWQGDPKDEVGRTVLFGTERSVNNHYYDIGFGWWFSPEINTIEGAPAVSIRGIFRGWIKPPGIDRNQQDTYMLIFHPVLKKEFLIRLGDSKKYKSPPTLVIDNLNFGGDSVSPEAYGTIHSFLTPKSQYGYDKGPVLTIDMVTQLDKIIQPGDVIEPFGRGGKSNLPFRDDYGVFIADLVYLRRFGGIEQMKKELG